MTSSGAGTGGKGIGGQEAHERSHNPKPKNKTKEMNLENRKTLRDSNSKTPNPNLPIRQTKHAIWQSARDVTSSFKNTSVIHCVMNGGGRKYVREIALASVLKSFTCYLLSDISHPCSKHSIVCRLINHSEMQEYSIVIKMEGYL